MDIFNKLQKYPDNSHARERFKNTHKTIARRGARARLRSCDGRLDVSCSVQCGDILCRLTNSCMYNVLYDGRNN